MREIRASGKKGGKAHSRSFGGTVWVSETEHHLWQELRQEIVTRSGMSGHIVLYRAAWLGFQLWKMALDGDYELDDLVTVLQEGLAHLADSRPLDREDVPSDALSAWATDMEMIYDKVQARDEALIRILEREGRQRFVELTQERDPDFDPIAWMKRVGLVYELPWREKARRLLGAYLLENGDTPRDEVIAWAREIKLIGDEHGRGSVGGLVKMASQEGFSGAGPYGKWGVPDGMQGIPTIDVSTFTESNDLVGLLDTSGESDDTLIT